MPGPQLADRYVSLRSGFFEKSLAELGLADLSKSQEVCAVLMDMAQPGGIGTVVALADGNASMYFSNGRAIIGGFAHDKVRAAAARLCVEAAKSQSDFSMSEDYRLPSKPGWLALFLRTERGILRADAFEALLQSNPAVYAVFKSAHDVISEIRRIPQTAEPGPPPDEGVTVTPEMERANVDLQRLVGKSLQQSNGEVHVETVLAAYGGIAGALLLLSLHAEELSHLKPGELVAGDKIEEGKRSLAEFFARCKAPLGLGPALRDEVPQENKSRLTPEQIDEKFAAGRTEPAHPRSHRAGT